MKIKYIIFCLLLIVSNVITYVVTANNNVKDFEAACLFADIIHSMMDSDIIGSEVEESYYEWTQDMDDTMKFDALKKKDLDNYSWCY